MAQLNLLAAALEYIEENINRDLKTEEISSACFCSKSTLEKLFKYVYHQSVHDYVRRRKMTLSARELVSMPHKTILEIAVSFGYESNEAFTRSFRQIWQCTPSQFRKKNRYFELNPRLLCPAEIGDDYMKNRKNVDISELYDLFQKRTDCLFICCDIKQMVEINQISHKAGDAAILESLNRLYAAGGEDDLVFRIGGDEFTILTNSTDEKYAESLMESILGKNGETFASEGQNIPLTLYCSICRLENTKKYSELFTGLHKTIQKSKA